jgi:hypothetical protein
MGLKEEYVNYEETFLEHKYKVLPYIAACMFETTLI